MSSIWFFGTGSFAATCLELLAQDPQCRPELVVTSPPTVAGRGLKERPSPVEEAALAAGLPLVRSSSVNRDDALKIQLQQRAPELVLVVDFGQKIDEPWLTGPRLGCLNIHPSLLPQYRGAAPVQRAIMEGCSVTGVTLFRLVEAMDAGPIWFQEAFAIGREETAGELSRRLAFEGSTIFKKGVKLLLSGDVALHEQTDTGISTAPKIHKAEALLDPDKTALVLHNQVRAMNPQPGAYFRFRGKRVKVWRTGVGDLGLRSGALKSIDGRLWLGTAQGALELIAVQPEGKGTMGADQWEKGLRLTGGEEIDC